MTNTSNTTLNMDYRPNTYWGVPEEILATLKGEGRRQAVQEAIDKGELDEVPELILADQLAEPLREMLAGYDPSYLDGENLPDYLIGEVEIARVIEEGDPGTVFSIRARRDGDVIRYRVVNDVDEIVSEGHQESSSEPLTFGELVTLIHEARGGFAYEMGLIHSSWCWHYDESGMTPEEAAENVSVSSSYYDQLVPWYEQHRREWIAERERQEADGAGEDADAKPQPYERYEVNEELVAALLCRYPEMTREEAIADLELAGW